MFSRTSNKIFYKKILSIKELEKFFTTQLDLLVELASMYILTILYDSFIKIN